MRIRDPRKTALKVWDEHWGRALQSLRTDRGEKQEYAAKEIGKKLGLKFGNPKLSSLRQAEQGKAPTPEFLDAVALKYIGDGADADALLAILAPIAEEFRKAAQTTEASTPRAPEPCEQLPDTLPVDQTCEEFPIVEPDDDEPGRGTATRPIGGVVWEPLNPPPDARQPVEEPHQPSEHKDSEPATTASTATGGQAVSVHAIEDAAREPDSNDGDPVVVEPLETAGGETSVEQTSPAAPPERAGQGVGRYDASVAVNVVVAQLPQQESTLHVVLVGRKGKARWWEPSEMTPRQLAVFAKSHPSLLPPAVAAVFLPPSPSDPDFVHKSQGGDWRTLRGNDGQGARWTISGWITPFTFAKHAEYMQNRGLFAPVTAILVQQRVWVWASLGIGAVIALAVALTLAFWNSPSTQPPSISETVPVAPTVTLSVTTAPNLANGQAVSPEQPDCLAEVDGRSPCRDDGKCTARNGQCLATSQDDCLRSRDCKGKGACTLVATNPPGCAVIIGSEADCRKTWGTDAYSLCANFGQCSWHGQDCVADTDAECQNSKTCKDNGLCQASGGRCVAHADDRCAATEDCLHDGRCDLLADGTCGERFESDADCRRDRGHWASYCLSFGKCSFSHGSCIATSDADCAKSAVCQAKKECVARDGACSVAR